MIDESELARWITVRQSDGLEVDITSTPEERAALAARFDLIAVETLKATVRLSRAGTTVTANGVLKAKIVQSCAVSGDDLPVTIAQTLHFAFVKDTGEQALVPDLEIELAEEDCDEIAYSGERFDLGETVAQSLGLAIDPYLEGPNAEEVRRKVDLSEPVREGPFAGLASLKRD